MIPDAWRSAPIAEIADIVAGGTPSTSVSEYWDGDIPWCTPTDITSTEGKTLNFTERTITQAGLASSAAKLLPEGSLLLCTRATVGDVRIAGRPTATNQGFKSLVVKSPNDHVFIYYQLATLRDRLLELSSGSTFLELSKKDLARVELLLPPPAEQKMIAEALSDADALVESLDALIAKKRDMKQAAMQQLLSGRIRLGGRMSEWSTLSVGFLATITKGSQLGRAEMNPMAEVPVWNGGVEPSGFTSIANVRRPVVTVSEGGNSCGWVGRPAGEFWLGGHCYALEPRDSHFSVGFLYHCLKSYEARIMGLRVGSGLPNIQTKSLAEFLVDVPSDPTEAANLTRVFDDMDAEIDALVAKREKAELVKQGMMQELLSGRVRLV